jgi:hypothetical protein
MATSFELLNALLETTHDHSVPVEEAVVGPTLEEMEEIRKIIEQARQECDGNSSVFARLVNRRLSKYGIKFGKLSNTAKALGSPAIETDETGTYLPLPSSWELQDPQMASRWQTILCHELVHARQISRMPNPAKVVADATAWMTPGGMFNSERYLLQKQEIMAWAASLVYSWKKQGLTAKQMRDRLGKGWWSTATSYWHARKQHPAIFKRFMRYANAYIDQYGS